MTVYLFPLALALVGPLMIVVGLVVVGVTVKNVEIMPFEGGDIQEPKDAYPATFVAWLSAAQSIVLDVQSTASRKKVAAGVLTAYAGLVYSAITVVPLTVAWLAVLRAS